MQRSYSLRALPLIFLLTGAARAQVIGASSVANPALRQELLERTCCNELPVTPNMINVLVRRIRTKIEADLGSPHLLRTAHGLGYTFAYNGDVFFDQITGRQFVSWPCF